MQKIQKPNEGEYAPYAIMYIDLVPQDGLVLKHLQEALQSTPKFILALPPEKLAVHWKEGEWSIKEILVHIMDTERIFCYRALRFARNDATGLAGFEQDAYVHYSGANEQDIAAVLECTEATARKHVARSRGRLRVWLAHLDPKNAGGGES